METIQVMIQRYMTANLGWMSEYGIVRVLYIVTYTPYRSTYEPLSLCRAVIIIIIITCKQQETNTKISGDPIHDTENSRYYCWRTR